MGSSNLHFQPSFTIISLFDIPVSKIASNRGALVAKRRLIARFAGNIKVPAILQLRTAASSSYGSTTHGTPPLHTSPSKPTRVVVRSESMPIDHILALLITERDKLNRAIEALQGPLKRRGRPPKNPLANAPAWVTGKPDKPERKKHSRKFTAAQRKEQSERVKAYWAAKKKAEAKSQPKTERKKTAKAA